MEVIKAYIEKEKSIEGRMQPFKLTELRVCLGMLL